MSESLNRSQFEHLLDEYLSEQLPDRTKAAFERYLEQHPAAREETLAVKKILQEIPDLEREAPPAELLVEATASLRHRLAHLDKANSRTRKRGRFWKPALAWGLAASLLLALGLTLWPNGTSLAFSQVVANLRSLDNLQVEGWIRGENGDPLPYRQWLLSNGTWRAEIGATGNQRTVVLNDHERLIKDRDGRLFRVENPGASKRDLDSVWRALQATYQSPDAASGSYEFHKQVLGKVVRFTRRDQASLGYGPANRKWVIDVERETALPILSQLYQLVDEQWVQVSELRFTGFDIPVDQNLFQVSGTPQPLTPEDRQRFWFELCISIDSVRLPAVMVPAGGLQLYWPAAQDLSPDISSGVAQLQAGGVSTLECRAMPLAQVVRGLSSLPVVDDELARQRVSVVISAKTVLPWQQSVKQVLNHLGLSYELTSKTITRKRYLVQQDGRPLPASRHRFASFAVKADTGGYHYRFEREELRLVVRNLLLNSDHQGQLAPTDTLIFQWQGPKQENPFTRPVDLACDIPGATFETNVDYLKKHLGIELKTRPEKIRVQRIKLIPGR